MRIQSILKSRLFKNGVWLYILQAFNTIIPILTLPYITRVLGPENYGLFSKVLNIIVYIQAIVEYGFTLTGARKIALNDNQQHLNKIYSRIVFSKIALFILSMFVVTIFMVVYPLSRNELIIFGILMSIVLSEILNQKWVFQGLQDMKLITLVTVVSRTVSVVLIFTMVKQGTDVYLYSFLFAVTYLLTGVISSLIVKFKFNIRLIRVSIREIMEELRDGWYLFTSSASSKLFSGIAVTVLAFNVSDALVGMYSAIQKIAYTISLAYFPIGQIIFPYISQVFSGSVIEGKDKVKKITVVIMSIMFLIVFTLIIFREELIILLFGNEFKIIKNIIIPLSISMILSVLNNLLGIQTLVASGYQKEYSLGFNLSTIVLIGLTLILGINFGVYGVAIASMVGEFTLLICNFYFIKKM